MTGRLSSRHAEDASFLWILRQRFVTQPNINLEDLEKLDRRLSAHLDGLRAVGQMGAEAAQAELDAFGGPGEVFTAAVLGILAFHPALFEAALSLAGKSSDHRAALVGAMEWVPAAAAKDHVFRLYQSGEATAQAISIDALVAHQQPSTAWLSESLEHDEAVVVESAARAVGELGLPKMSPRLVGLLSHDELGVCFAAARSLARFGNKACAGVLLAAIGDELHAREACTILASQLPPGDQNSLLTMLDRDGEARLRIIAMGATGLPRHIPALLEMLDEPALARVAGESFSMITGADLEALGLAEVPPRQETSPNDDPSDDTVELDEDSALAWPLADAVRKWWAGHEQQFDPSQRYLAGRLIDQEGLNKVLKAGYQRQRYAASWEQSFLDIVSPLFRIQSPARRQRAALAP